MKITHYRLFLDSLLHPKKHAAFRLLSIGKLIQFLFLIALLISIPASIQFIEGLSTQKAATEGLSSFLHAINWLLYPLSFLFIIIFNITILFIQASLYALLALCLLKFFQRRGEYRMLWRTAAFSMILGVLLSTVLSFFFTDQLAFHLLAIAITTIYLLIAIQKYPKQATAKNS
ncbi:DUF1189 family protein [Kurthia sibirica]|uniref:4-hydroxy-3-methylbut-2-en-1-yl diphosphate synthase n=1 Tax=Kurthia sibirica TaxID=202750 RepID=A0A2U3AM35_9BACL|nr:DUF1189 family protein [Kurthia sibirica]PWI25557.1 4-hydroxy-3-methylbut-2-en-1-yl diphosphate synthase [Kurthia sibirica]GEK33936.1 hypothetical protein KSI01_14690 [Kurthia sibirica]